MFGEHTFFLDSHGLNIVEPAEAAGSGAQLAKVVNVANWSDANRNRLEPHEPEPTDVVVTLGSKHSSKSRPIACGATIRAACALHRAADTTANPAGGAPPRFELVNKPVEWFVVALRLGGGCSEQSGSSGSGWTSHSGAECLGLDRLDPKIQQAYHLN